MDFSNREIATGILITLGAVLLITFSKDRRCILQSLKDLLKILFAWEVLLPIGLYFAYAAAILLAAWSLGWWDHSLLSVTILAVVVTGLPIFMNAYKYTDGVELTRKVVLEVAGLSALMVTYLNLGEFPIWGELILQAVISFIVLITVMAPRVQNGKRVGRVFEVLLGIIGIALLVSTTSTVLRTYDSVDWLHEVQSFAVSVWLPIALVPFLYVTALAMATESTLNVLRVHRRSSTPSLSVRLALVVGFRGSLRYAKRFSGTWITEMAEQRSFKTGLAVMRDYRTAVRVRVAEQRDRNRRLKQFKGARGFDNQGLWLDRREFYETRAILEDVWFTQAAIARNQKKFVNEPFLLSSVYLRKLPKDHGIQIVLAKNARSWYAWRKTAGDFYFATGGSTKDVNAHWQYSGTKPPDNFPHRSARGWVNSTSSEKDVEWSTDVDLPVPQV